MKKKLSVIICAAICAVFALLCLSGCGFFGRVDYGETAEGYKYSLFGTDELYVSVNGVRYARKQENAEYFYVAGYVSEKETYEIEATEILTEIDGLPVTYVASLSGHNKVRSITIPEGITAISSLAFMYDRALETIILPESLTSIGGGSF